MHDIVNFFAAVTATSWLTLSALLSQTRSADSPAQNSHDASAEAVEEEIRHEVEQQRQSLEEEAKKTLDQDAVVIVEETHNAIRAVESNNNPEAAEVIRRALEGVQRLLTRNPATAEIAADIKVEICDAAPVDSTSIIEIAQDASRAFDDKDFPTARVLLHSLMSEIRLRKYSLPLTTFPEALRRAARLLDENKNQSARAVLLTAIKTFVISDRVIPIPLLTARYAIGIAQREKEQNKPTVNNFLEIARNELDRASKLGYAGSNPEYTALRNQIVELQEQLTDKEDVSSAFGKLAKKLTEFLHRQSGNQHG